VNVRYRAVSCSNHTLKVGRCVRSRWIRVCFRMSQRLIVHPRTDATNSGKRSTTNNVTSYTLNPIRFSEPVSRGAMSVSSVPMFTARPHGPLLKFLLPNGPDVCCWDD
jgi:hypothetical protein